MDDLRELDRDAVFASVAVAANLTRDDLGRATPCAGWSVADLLAHMIAQHQGFAAASAGAGADPSVWEVRPLGEDPAWSYAAASLAVIAAFAEPGVEQQQFHLPAISSTLEFTAAQAISFHFVDYVVHGWDLAKSIDVPIEHTPDLLDAALALAATVPAGEARLTTGAAFRPVLDAPEGAGQIERVVAMLGRSPDWPNT